MRKALVLVIIAGLCVLSAVPANADEIYAERVADGTLDLEWHGVHGPDTLAALKLVEGDPAYPNPSGDTHVGELWSIPAGPHSIATTLATESVITDCRLDAWLFVGSGAARVGVLFRSTDDAGYGYQYVIEPGLFQLKFRRDDGEMVPVTLGLWMGGEIPGGPPAPNTWHRFSVEMAGDDFDIYFDDQPLPDNHFVDDTYASGLFGLYIFYPEPGSYQLIADDIIASEIPTAVEETSWAAIKVLYRQ